MRFDLADLSLFRHVIDAGSITRGAERAHLALAAASTRIRHMEETLGATLLVRTRQGVTPTQAGRTLLQHARIILRQAERLREDLSAYSGGLAGQIRVLSNTNALTEFLPEALSSFLATHPHVSVDLEERLSDEIVSLIAEGVADLGIVAGTVDAGALATVSLPPRPLRSRGRPRSSARAAPADRVRGRARLRFRRARSGKRAATLLADKAARAGKPLRLRDAAAQLRCGVPPGRMQRRHRHRAGDHGALGDQDHGDRHRPAERPWAVRDLTICIRSFADLPTHARQLVEHLRASDAHVTAA